MRPQWRRRQSPNCRIPLPRRRISPPPRGNSRPPMPRRAGTSVTPSAISEILEPQRRRIRAPRSNRICRRITRSNPARGRRPGGFAVGAHRGFRKRHQRDPGCLPRDKPAPRISSPPRAAPRRPPRPPRPPTRPRAAPLKSAAGERPRSLEHHLQNPLAAGRRQRGRDRARHVQDGDDAARQRPPPQCRQRRIPASTACGAAARRMPAPAAMPDASHAVDDLADADRRQSLDAPRRRIR